MRRTPIRQVAPSLEKQQLTEVLSAINQEKANLEQTRQDVESAQNELQRLSDLKRQYSSDMLGVKQSLNQLQDDHEELLRLNTDEASTIERLLAEKYDLLSANDQLRQQSATLITEQNRNNEKLTSDFTQKSSQLQSNISILQNQVNDLNQMILSLVLQKVNLDKQIEANQKEAGAQQMNILLKNIEISGLNERFETLTSDLEGQSKIYVSLQSQVNDLGNQKLSLEGIIKQKQEQIDLLDEEIEEKKIASLTVVARVDSIKQLQDNIRHLYEQAGLDIDKQK